jgi:hypothetical protein
VIIAGLAALAGLMASHASAAPARSGIHAAYVLLAPAPDGGTVPLARVIIPAGQDCPRLARTNGSVEMTARANPNPATFPVEVCEAVYGFGEAVTIAGSDIALPTIAPDPGPQHIVVLGDTGCKGGSSQDCTDPAAWPFGTFAAAAAHPAPDLVIHLGDYNYRGTPGRIAVGDRKENVYDAGDSAPADRQCQLGDSYVSQNVSGSQNWDSWANWQADFFDPAAPLLSRAPWVVARGNHELCSRAGPGFFYFLDPHSSLLGGELSCPVQQLGGQPLPNLVFVPPYRVDFGRLNLVVMDSANACDTFPNFTATYAQQFEAVQELAADRLTWLIGHRPIWGVDQGASPGQFDISNAALQQALRQSSGGSLPASVQLVLAGHMHRFEAVSFETGRPPQLVIGNSGTQLNDNPLAGPFTADVDGEAAKGLAANEFGYLDIRLRPTGDWLGMVVDPRLSGTKALAFCGTHGLKETGQICVPAQELKRRLNPDGK